MPRTSRRGSASRKRRAPSTSPSATEDASLHVKRTVRRRGELDRLHALSRALELRRHARAVSPANASAYASAWSSTIWSATSFGSASFRAARTAVSARSCSPRRKGRPPSSRARSRGRRAWRRSPSRPTQRRVPASIPTGFASVHGTTTDREVRDDAIAVAAAPVSSSSSTFVVGGRPQSDVVELRRRGRAGVRETRGAPLRAGARAASASGSSSSNSRSPATSGRRTRDEIHTSKTTSRARTRLSACRKQLPSAAVREVGGAKRQAPPVHPPAGAFAADETDQVIAALRAPSALRRGARASRRAGRRIAAGS